MIAIAQVAIRFIQPFMLPYPGAVFRQQRQQVCSYASRSSGLFFTEFRWLTGEKIYAPAHRPLPPTAGRDFPRCTVLLRYYALHIFAAVVQRLSHGWNDMFRRILQTEAIQRESVTDSSFAQSWLKRLRKRSTGALHNVCSMGLSVVNFNEKRYAFAAAASFRYTIPDCFVRPEYGPILPEHLYPCSVIATAFTLATTPTPLNIPFRA